MKTYSINFAYTVSEDIKIKAKNQKEAIRKFRETRPDERILDVYEVDLRSFSFDEVPF